MPHDVFISYSTIDKAAANAACATFEAAGIRCWIAPRDIKAGTEWAEAIIDAIDGATVMVLIFSSNSNDSRQVRREIELAIHRGLTIMPLRLEAIEPTRSMAYYMAGIHWIDALSPPLEGHLKKMVEWIRPHVGNPSQPKAKPAPKPEPKPQPAPRRDERPEAPPMPPPRQAPKPAEKPKRSSGIFGDIFYEFFGHKSADGSPGKIRINEAAKAIDAAVKLANGGKPDEAIAAYLALIERIEEADAAPLDLNLATALLNLGITYRGLGRHNEALEAYARAVRECGDTTDQMVEKIVAMAMNNRASLLIDLGRSREALTIHDDLVARFADTYNTDLALQVGVARLNRGVALGALKRDEEAVAAYDELIARSNLKVFPGLGAYVTQARANRQKVEERIALRRGASR